PSQRYAERPSLRSIPTRRSSDLMNGHTGAEVRLVIRELRAEDETGVEALAGLSLKVCAHEIVGIAGVSGNGQRELVQVLAGQREDRKSTRLNSSHVKISYAVFCL